MKIFISYTSSDQDWAHWIGHHLIEAGHVALVHEWEISAGENIARWMEEKLNEADRLLGVFSDAYCDALYSQSERWAAYWQDPGGPMQTARQPFRQHVFPHPPRAVGPVARNEAGAHLCAKLFVASAAPTARSCQPGIEPTSRDTERLAQPTCRPDPPVLRNETELHVDSFAK